MQGVAREINQRPGACVCVARWNGDIIYYNPGKYMQHIRGESSPERREGKSMAIIGNIILGILWTAIGLFVLTFCLLAGKAKRGEA